VNSVTVVVVLLTQSRVHKVGTGVLIFSSSNYHKLVEVGSGSAIRIDEGLSDDPDPKEIFLDSEY
jgi:hypothetical protein